MPFEAEGVVIPDSFFANPADPTIDEVQAAVDQLVPRDTAGRFLPRVQVVTDHPVHEDTSEVANAEDTDAVAFAHQADLDAAESVDEEDVDPDA